MVDFLKKPTNLTRVSLVLSLFTLVTMHWPFFRLAAENVEGDFNGVFIIFSLALLLLGLNFLFYYLVLFLGRFVGKCILAFTFIANAVALYFINTYNALITDKMMGNVFNTQYSEASGFFSWMILLYIVLLGVLPCVYLFARHFEYGTWKRFLSRTGIALAVSVVVAVVNVKNWTWVDRNIPTLGSVVMPWSYIVNTIRYQNSVAKSDQQETLLPDVNDMSDSKDVCVLIIGESARRANFSLYGYEKQTNPLLEKDSVSVLVADASATYTTAGVKAILDHQPSNKLYEILPNYLYRNGVDVVWRTTNWGEPPVHIDRYLKAGDIKKLYPEADERYDGILLAGLKDEILACDKDKMLIVLHTSTSHGPTYNNKYPSEFEVFTPVCKTVEMSKTNPEELVNAYDNTIVYTDYLIHSVIDILKEIPQRRGCVIYVSDHGESLGEGNMYMHGVPMFAAPKEQIEIPFIVWTSDRNMEVDEDDKVGHYHVFHSVLRFFGIDSPVYDKSLDVFEQSEEN